MEAWAQWCEPEIGGCSDVNQAGRRGLSVTVCQSVTFTLGLVESGPLQKMPGLNN